LTITSSLAWWLALPLLLLPLWWHRRRREQGAAAPLASARFLPRADPRKLRRWAWRDRPLLLARLLLLALTIAWLADLMLAWRGDAVLVAPGADTAWVGRQVKASGMDRADRLTLPSGDGFGWLARHQREWQDGSRLLLLGDVPMPALMPRLRHEVIVRRPDHAAVAASATAPRHVAIVSARADRWRAVFSAIDGPQRYVIDAVPGPLTTLTIWDRPGAAPPGLNVWANPGDPPQDAAAARAWFECAQRLYFAMPSYPTPSQRIAAAPVPAPAPDRGGQPYLLTLSLIALFALERILAHASRR
jgi:hypothetical protein